VHSILELWDPRAAMTVLARGVLHRSTRHVGRSWFVLWPAIPEPALYASPALRACAA
jgi:hypothetical protein